MKVLFLLVAALLGVLPLTRAASPPTALDLIGKWEAHVEMGRFKAKLIIKVVKNAAGRLDTTLDFPEQGQKDMPINALLFNNPAVRIEIDQFGTAYNGILNEERTEINGAFEEGPGGRPINVTFKRSNEPDQPEPEKIFTFAKGEPADIRGYWKSSLEIFPGAQVTVALNIGRIKDGTFRATMDVLDQGAKDIPAASVSYTNKTSKIEWQAFQTVFEATLSDDGRHLAGDWKSGGRSHAVTFERTESPASALSKELSFTPDKSKPDDPRGYWLGSLETPGGRLRLAFKVGTASDGTYAGTMSSLDQGGREIPMSSISITAAKTTFEWKGLRAKFEGKLNAGGTTIDGTWEQMGNPLPLKMERKPMPEDGKKN